MTKKTLVIIIAALTSAAVALICALLLVKHISHKKENLSNYESSYSSLEDTSSTPENIPAAVVDNGIRLSMTAPATPTLNLTESFYTFAGKGDPAEPLTVNGTPLEMNWEGLFTYEVNLNIGKNIFNFEHKGETHTYTINYRYVIINSFSPSTKQAYSCGSTFGVSATARKGSSVTAHFNGQTITLQPQAADNNEVFIPFTGSFQLPSDNLYDMNLGKITFTASINGKSESFKSADIICLKPDIIVDYDPNATPLGGRYVNVGSGKIAEIVDYQAETFDAKSTNDMSKPTNNYLPEGTVDYSSTQYYYYTDKSGTKQFAQLRCGYEVYTGRKDIPGNKYIQVIKEYTGTLPDHNEVGVSSLENNGRHTVLTMDVDWKAPFYFDILPQQYTNPAKQDFTISQATYNYIDITFCYATVFEGELPDLTDNPIFSSCQLIQNQSDYTLRLFLRKQGGFYGWDSYYNDQGQLVFEFLNPAEITNTEKPLTGISILIDVGHGGTDPGASGFDSEKHNEAIQNLELANYIRAELEAMGATVLMTRTSNITSTNDDKMKMLERLKPDYCIAIHHNSNNSSTPQGFEAFYGNAFSWKAAQYVYTNTLNTGIYNSSKLDWHYYYMCRTTACPVVLTENGYISNLFDYGRIIAPEYNRQKAVAIAKSILDYFNYIQ